MKKSFYIVLMILYVFLLAIWCFRFPISYKIATGINPDLVTRDLTKTEFDSLKKAYRIRQTIAAVLLYGSAILALCSFIALRTGKIKQRLFLKITLIIATVIAVLLITINGVHFIPTPPIR